MKFDVKKITSSNLPEAAPTQSKSDVVKLPELSDESAKTIENEFIDDKMDMPELDDLPEVPPKEELFKSECIKHKFFGEIPSRKKNMDTSAPTAGTKSTAVKYGIYGLMAVALLTKIF